MFSPNTIWKKRENCILQISFTSQRSSFLRLLHTSHLLNNFLERVGESCSMGEKTGSERCRDLAMIRVLRFKSRSLPLPLGFILIPLPSRLLLPRISQMCWKGIADNYHAYVLPSQWPRLSLAQTRAYHSLDGGLSWLVSVTSEDHVALSRSGEERISAHPPKLGLE